MSFYVVILPLALYEGYYQFGQYRHEQNQRTSHASTSENDASTTDKVLSSTTNIQYIDRGYYWNYPDHQTFISYNEDGEKIIINTDALGFRNPSVDKKVDILLLGDSFTSAANTKNELTFASQLRKAGWSVYNAGIDGTGTVHQAHILKDVLAHVKPKIVILNFYLGNDFRDNFYCPDIAAVSSVMNMGKKAGDTPTAMDSSITQTPLSITVKAKLHNLMNYSGVLKLMYNTVYLPGKYEGTDMGYYDRGEMMMMAHKTACPNPDVVKALDKTQNAIAFIKKTLEEKNIKFVIVGIPSKAQVMKSVREISNFDSDKKGTEFFSKVKNDLDFDKPDQILKELCVQNHIPYISLLKPFREQQHNKKLFYHFDAHWNYIGQETAVNQVLPYLKKNSLLTTNALQSS